MSGQIRPPPRWLDRSRPAAAPKAPLASHLEAMAARFQAGSKARKTSRSIRQFPRLLLSRLETMEAMAARSQACSEVRNTSTVDPPTRLSAALQAPREDSKPILKSTRRLEEASSSDRSESKSPGKMRKMTRLIDKRYHYRQAPDIRKKHQVDKDVKTMEILPSVGL